MAVAQDVLEALAEAARSARAGAYAPYSEFPVGCAVLLADGTTVTGANIENGVYPVGLCAERAAIATVFSSRPAGERDIVAVVVVGPEGVADCSPCGGCRQWLHEFASDATIAFPQHGKLHATTAAELLPYGFTLP